VKYLPLVTATLLRHKGRTLFTGLSVVTAFMLFSVLAAVRYGMLGKLAVSGAERLDTYNLIAQGDPLPLSYYGKITSVPGVLATTYLNGLPGYYQHRENAVVALAASPTIFELFPEIRIPASELRTWQGDRQGAVAGAALAARLGWKVGDSIPIRSAVPRKDGNPTWQFHLDGVFRSNLPAVDQSFIIHYEYLNNAVADPGQHDVVGEYEERIADPRQVTRISNAIDHLFADSSPPTLTQSDEQDTLNEVRQFGNIGAIVIYVGIAVFFSLMLIVGNSVVQSVRERDTEFAVLQAMGFSSAWIVRLVLRETLLLLVTGSMVGLTLGWMVTRALYPRLGNVLETFQLTWSAAAMGLLLGIAFGTVAALLPARRITGLQVAAVLRGT
jgi:putative ABC transport system permease protein